MSHHAPHRRVMVSISLTAATNAEADATWASAGVAIVSDAVADPIRGF